MQVHRPFLKKVLGPVPAMGSDPLAVLFIATKVKELEKFSLSPLTQQWSQQRIKKVKGGLGPPGHPSKQIK